jgi:hypothetical protein
MEEQRLKPLTQQEFDCSSCKSYYRNNRHELLNNVKLDYWTNISRLMLILDIM